jgi:hypothetical protein
VHVSHTAVTSFTFGTPLSPALPGRAGLPAMLSSRVAGGLRRDRGPLGAVTGRGAGRPSGSPLVQPCQACLRRVTARRARAQVRRPSRERITHAPPSHAPPDAVTPPPVRIWPGPARNSAWSVRTVTAANGQPTVPTCALFTYESVCYASGEWRLSLHQERLHWQCREVLIVCKPTV